MKQFHYKSWSVEWHTELASTMIRAGELAEIGSPSSTVVVADFQSAGRGTGGRHWIAPPRSCLMFTTSSTMDITPERLQFLPGTVASAVSKTILEVCGIQSSVKPPNDVVTPNGKLCGILCTSRVRGGSVEWVNCGVGLNTFMCRDQLPTKFSTSLALETRIVPHHKTLLFSLLDNFEFMRGDANVIPNADDW